MGKAAKVAFSLEQDLLDQVERIRARTGESRSALIARALAAVTKEDARRVQVERYVEAYREHPETDEEVTSARAAARRALSRLPWEER
jgi:metal-responsive CopG/Arc/MetJ family transcriptional regulator